MRKDEIQAVLAWATLSQTNPCFEAATAGPVFSQIRADNDNVPGTSKDWLTGAGVIEPLTAPDYKDQLIPILMGMTAVYISTFLVIAALLLP